MMNNTLMNAVPSPGIFPAEFLLTHVGVPFVIGMAVGYFAKKMLRMALFLGGAAIVLLFVGEYYQFIRLSPNTLESMVQEATRGAQSFGAFLVTRLGKLTSQGVSGVGGFFVGLKFG